MTLSAVIYGFNHLSTTEFKVIHEHQPLFIRLSDGSIQNKYTLKLLNKTKETMQVNFEMAGLGGATLDDLGELVIKPVKFVPLTAFVKVPAVQYTPELSPIQFIGKVEDKPTLSIVYFSMFLGPS